MKLKLLGILTLIFLASGSFAQSDLELAEYYFNNGEYEKALLYYESIYKTNRTEKVYSNYLNSLIAIGDFDEAEKVVKKKLKDNGNKANVHVDLGELYKKFDRQNDAEEEFGKAIKELLPGRSNVTRLANAFIQLGEYGYAKEAYLKGRRTANDGYEFHYEMANLQGMMGNLDEMVESFMELLLTAPNYIQTVQNSLNRNLNVAENAERGEMLRVKLLQRVQKYPEATIYSELLIWLFLQQKDFASAMVQARALDKRLNENGSRMINLAQLAKSNADYPTAREAYNYVIDKGNFGEYYVTARMELLQVMLDEITARPGYPIDDIVDLETTYELTLDELGMDASTAIIVKELAHIKGFYLGKTDEAIALLYDALEIPGMYSKITAVIKLELGDVLLLTGDIWESSLLYSQVELDFKEDVLGHEAKFRNAKISYYTGDFEWAQSQLDVLKASTSKLISNDAIDLSLLISDNFNMDTTIVPMLMFAQSDLLAYQNRVDEALLKLDSISTMWPGHSLSDDILMLKSDIFYQRGDFAQSAVFLQTIIDLYFTDILADDAVFKLAEINQFVYEDLEQAQLLYKQILDDFPGSLYVVEARKRYRELRGDAIN
jgi:tetratricopeptide (TPR) repeat protein